MISMSSPPLLSSIKGLNPRRCSSSYQPDAACQLTRSFSFGSSHWWFTRITNHCDMPKGDTGRSQI